VFVFNSNEPGRRISLYDLKRFGEFVLRVSRIGGMNNDNSHRRGYQEYILRNSTQDSCQNSLQKTSALDQWFVAV